MQAKIKTKNICNKLQHKRILFVDNCIKRFGPVSSNQIVTRYCDEHGEVVSTKTIKRDLDYLRHTLDAPIEYDASKKGFYYSDPSFFLPSFHVSEGELFAIGIAQKAIQMYKGTSISVKLNAIFEKICATLPDQIKVSSHEMEQMLTFSPEHSAPVDVAVWDSIEKALQSHRKIKMLYYSPNYNENVIRTIDPYHLRCFRGDWYIIGKENRWGHFPTYALRRIRKLELLEDTFDVDPSFSPDKHFQDTFGLEQGQETYPIKIKFTGCAARHIREKKWHPEQKLKVYKNGNLTLQFPSRSLDEVKRWVITWGAEAKVLAPKILIKNVHDHLKETLRHYK